jgi:hypothetical protein
VKYLRAVAFSFSTVALYLGLPLFGLAVGVQALVGWGIRDPPEYFSLAPRLGYALLVAAFGLAVGVQALGGTEGIRAGAGEEGKPVPRQHVVRAVMVLLLY